MVPELVPAEKRNSVVLPVNFARFGRNLAFVPGNVTDFRDVPECRHRVMSSSRTVGPPHALLIYRDTLVAGREADYKAIEEDAARICAELNCPNAHLAVESLTGPHEVWWLTPYESDADIKRIADGYANNPALTTALEEYRQAQRGGGRASSGGAGELPRGSEPRYAIMDARRCALPRRDDEQRRMCGSKARCSRRRTACATS